MKRRIILTIRLVALLLATPAAHAVGDWDTYSDTWVAVDELGRVVNTSESGLPLPRENRAVGMFYFICNGPHGTNGDPIYDVTEILKANPANPQFGPEGKPHWWGKPQLGYYVNTDGFVYDKHLQMLADAGVDFLFLDVTNAFTYDEAVKCLMASIDRRTAVGLPSPKLVYTLHAGSESVVKHLWSVFYSKPEYDKYWFYYGGKPLMFVNRSELAGVDAGVKDHFTMRNCWAWMRGIKPDEWGWLEYYPQACGWTYVDGWKTKEQISVSTAQHATTKIGKSYHGGRQPAIDAYGVCGDTPKGLYFAEQWKQAFAQDPPIVMITQFNEWIATRFVAKTTGDLGDCRPGSTPAIGESVFVDAYNAEFNRDIEPGTHPLVRDNYYLQMVSNVRKYKGVRPIPTPSAAKTISLDGDMAQWQGVTPEFRDDIGDITHRKTGGFQNMAPMTNNSGRNDIVAAKVAMDADNMYFYVRTASNFSNFNFSKQWMMLFINSDCNYQTGWNGYDYAVMKNPADGKYTLMRCAGKEYEWTAVAPVPRYVKQNEMYFALPKNRLNITSGGDVDFKWADNTPAKPDIMDFIDQGDVAPNGRFNYRYKGSAVSTGIGRVSVDALPGITALRTGDGLLKVAYKLPVASGVAVDVYNVQGVLLKSARRGVQASGAISLEVGESPVVVKVQTDTGTKVIKLR